jgi:hypothetical protein
MDLLVDLVVVVLVVVDLPELVIPQRSPDHSRKEILAEMHLPEAYLVQVEVVVQVVRVLQDNLPDLVQEVLDKYSLLVEQH